MSGQVYRRAFCRREYDGRLARVRAAMLADRRDLLLVSAPENICYLTGYQTSAISYQALILALEGLPYC